MKVQWTKGMSTEKGRDLCAAYGSGNLLGLKRVGVDRTLFRTKWVFTVPQSLGSDQF